MKRTKASKKRLNNLLMVLMLAVVLMIMSTYAWFTSNRTASVESINVSVAATSGLQISADGVNWKAILRKDDIVNAGGKLPTQMGAVSTTGSLTNGSLDMYNGELTADTDASHTNTYGQYLLKTTKATDATATTYAVFDLYLKVDEKQETIYLNGGVKHGSTNALGAANAGRIALVKSANTIANGAAVSGLTTNGGTVMLWEPNYDTHTVSGIANAQKLGKGTLLESGNEAVACDGVKAEMAFTDLITETNATAAKNPDHFATVTPTYKTKTADHGKQNLTLTGGLEAGITKIKVYLWVEGQDVDCENSASGSDLTYDLSFSLDQAL